MQLRGKLHSYTVLCRKGLISKFLIDRNANRTYDPVGRGHRIQKEDITRVKFGKKTETSEWMQLNTKVRGFLRK